MAMQIAAVGRITIFLIVVLVAWAKVATPSAQAERPLVMVEDRIVSSKALMTIDVGHYRRVVQIAPNGRDMHIQFEIKVDVSAVVLSYHRHTLVDAWYDRDGLVAFVTELDEDGKRTVLNGRRELQVGNRVELHLEGMIDGQPVDKRYPADMIHYTNLENFPVVAAMGHERQTWRVLNLFNGEIELVRITPEGVENCPAPSRCSCYRVKLWSPSREGLFYYTGDGLLSYARGDDKLGHFILRRREPRGLKSGEAPEAQTAPRTEAEAAPQQNGGLFDLIIDSFWQAPAPAEAEVVQTYDASTCPEVTQTAPVFGRQAEHESPEPADETGGRSAPVELSDE